MPTRAKVGIASNRGVTARVGMPSRDRAAEVSRRPFRLGAQPIPRYSRPTNSGERMAKRPRRGGQPDSLKNEVRLLDVGPDNYGDCILCRLGGKTILID